VIALCYQHEVTSFSDQDGHEVVESGYGEELNGLRQRSLALLRAGVVGLNIEDRLSVCPGYRKSGSHCRGSFIDAGAFADLTQLKHRQ